MRTSLEIVAELTIEFSRAESACKAFEHQDGGLPIPVVNELRYAGAHAIKALKRGIDDSEECREELDKALRHCKRARYDALEFNVVLATERLDKCIDMYRGYEWLAAPLIPRYYEHSRLIREAGHKLESTSGIDKESELYIGNCMEHIRTIEAFIQDFETAMPVIFLCHPPREGKGRPSRKVGGQAGQALMVADAGDRPVERCHRCPYRVAYQLMPAPKRLGLAAQSAPELPLN